MRDLTTLVTKAGITVELLNYWAKLKKRAATRLKAAAAVKEREADLYKAAYWFRRYHIKPGDRRVLATNGAVYEFIATPSADGYPMAVMILSNGRHSEVERTFSKDDLDMMRHPV